MTFAGASPKQRSTHHVRVVHTRTNSRFQQRPSLAAVLLPTARLAHACSSATRVACAWRHRADGSLPVREQHLGSEIRGAAKCGDDGRTYIDACLDTSLLLHVPSQLKRSTCAHTTHKATAESRHIPSYCPQKTQSWDGGSPGNGAHCGTRRESCRTETGPRDTNSSQQSPPTNSQDHHPPS